MLASSQIRSPAQPEDRLLLLSTVPTLVVVSTLRHLERLGHPILVMLPFNKGEVLPAGTLEKEFLEKFGRSMTDEERRFYELTKGKTGSRDFVERRKTAKFRATEA